MPTLPIDGPPARLHSAAAAQGFGRVLAETAARLDRDEQALRRALAASGTRSGPELLALQAVTYRFAHDLGMSAKLVDAGLDAVRRVADATR